MANMDPIDYAPLCKLFPELTKNQIVNICLYTSGATHKQIAQIRDVSQDAVRQSFSSAQKRLRVVSSSELRSVFMARLIIDMYMSVNTQKNILITPPIID